MDTSAEYIKMCTAAREIQLLWHTDAGDFFFTKNPNLSLDPVESYPFGSVGIHMCAMGSNECWFADPNEDTWLPRQDQLQEMLNPVEQEGFLERFPYDLEWEVPPFTYGDFRSRKVSWEMLWLIHVMSEKFRKTWNGEAWLARVTN